MTPKLKLILLGIVVTLVWGLIAYKIIAGVSGSDEDIKFATPDKLSTRDDPKGTIDTFRLIANYRDPFLPVDMEGYDSDEEIISVEYTEPAPIINWPQIVYKGLIKNNAANKTIAILAINTQELLLTPGETHAGVKVVEVLNDSIRLAYLKEIKTFGKQSR